MPELDFEVNLSYKLLKERFKQGFSGDKYGYAPNIYDYSFGTTIIDRLTQDISGTGPDGGGTSEINYFKIIGDSQEFTLDNKVYTTDLQTHFLWRHSELGHHQANANIYGDAIYKMFTGGGEGGAPEGMGTAYNNIAGKMIGTLELNLVPAWGDKYDISGALGKIDRLKILIPIFKTGAINKNGMELLNCMKTDNDSWVPTKKIDMSGFIPKTTPYILSKFKYASSIYRDKKDGGNHDVCTLIFMSSNIHLDETYYQHDQFNDIILFNREGHYVSDTSQFLFHNLKGIQHKFNSKKCTELYNEGETSSGYNNSTKLEQKQTTLAALVSSPQGVSVIFIFVIFLFRIIYKLIFREVKATPVVGALLLATITISYWVFVLSAESIDFIGN